jgi:hypothetical protein
VNTVVYLRGGLGDFYPFLSIWPTIIKDYKLENIKYFLDTAYLNNVGVGYNFNKQSLLYLLNICNIHEYTIIPPQFSCSADILYPDAKARVDGPTEERIKNEFMCWRRAETKEYIKCQLKSADDVLIDMAFTEQTFMWKNNEYKELKIDNRPPLAVLPDDREKEYVHNLCKEPHVVIHIRIKGRNESSNNFNNIINYCKTKNIKCILVGFLAEGTIAPQSNIIDLRDSKISFPGQMYLMTCANNVIASGSGFAYHRLYHNFTNKKTILCYPKSFGDVSHGVYKGHLQNPNHIFVDVDDPNYISTIHREIDKFN